MNQITSAPASTTPEATAPAGRPWRIAVVASNWHRDIVGQAIHAIRDELGRASTPPGRLDVVEVPGAFEIPLHAKRLAQSGRYDAIIAVGLVVNGGIYRHEFVAAAVIDGLMRIQLDTDTPMFSAVLTPRDFHEHEEHRSFFAAHFVKKGEEVAQACVRTLASLDRLANVMA